MTDQNVDLTVYEEAVLDGIRLDRDYLAGLVPRTRDGAAKLRTERAREGLVALTPWLGSEPVNCQRCRRALKGLERLGLVERVAVEGYARPWVRVTPAGEAVLAALDEPPANGPICLEGWIDPEREIGEICGGPATHGGLCAKHAR